MSQQNAKLILNGKEYEFPVMVGSEGEIGIDAAKLRASTGAITLDPGYGNTGSCTSKITFINGEKGILKYRGYPIEQIAEKSNFLETAYLSIYGELPNKEQYTEWNNAITTHSLIHEDMKKFLEGYQITAHPMSILSALLVSLSQYYDTKNVDLNIIRLIAKIKTIIAWSYKAHLGQRYNYPRNDLSYEADFLHMMFAIPSEEYKVSPVVEKALRLLLILHVDHEQNCSASTVRMVGSSQANLFACMAAGVCALWGPLHGGANQKVLEMLNAIVKDGGDYEKYMKMAKDKDSGFRLMGFGHRVYKNRDPRAEILKGAAADVLAEMGAKDPLLEVAKGLEKIALEDSYFVERKLYPNVDFYSGIIYKALGIPVDFFTPMFALGRLPGWIAQWKEEVERPGGRIHRPRQIFNGYTTRDYVPMEKR
ncbi:MAG: citrate synthase [Candidatus Hodarchaeales archaeon]|jgi:citrate synthase